MKSCLFCDNKFLIVIFFLILGRKNVEFIYGQPDSTVKEVLDSDFHEDLLVVLNNSRCTIS